MGVEKWAVEGVVECVIAAKDKTDAVDLLVVLFLNLQLSSEMLSLC